jgi:hypothetical protein
VWHKETLFNLPYRSNISSSLAKKIKTHKKLNIDKGNVCINKRGGERCWFSCQFSVLLNLFCVFKEKKRKWSVSEGKKLRKFGFGSLDWKKILKVYHKKMKIYQKSIFYHFKFFLIIFLNCFYHFYSSSDISLLIAMTLLIGCFCQSNDLCGVDPLIVWADDPSHCSRYLFCNRDAITNEVISVHQLDCRSIGGFDYFFDGNCVDLNTNCPDACPNVLFDGFMVSFMKYFLFIFNVNEISKF